MQSSFYEENRKGGHVIFTAAREERCEGIFKGAHIEGGKKKKKVHGGGEDPHEVRNPSTGRKKTFFLFNIERKRNMRTLIRETLIFSPSRRGIREKKKDD